MLKSINRNMGWCRLAYEVMRDKELTDKDVLLYSVLLDCCSNELVCTVGKSELISLSGGRISEKTLFRSLARLEKIGYIERTGIAGEKNVYKIADIIGLKRQKSRPTTRQTKILSVPEQQEIKLLYGEYKRVALTVDQFDKLVQDFGQQRAAEYIKRCDEYCQRTGKTYADYDLTIRKWIADDQTDADGMTEKERQKMAEYMSVVNRFEKV